MKYNTPYYLAAILLFIGLKWVYKMADTEHLFFLLQPSSRLVGLLTGAPCEYLSDTGAYAYPTLGIVIEKSCSGYNFWLLCTMMLFFQFLNASHSAFQKTKAFFGAIVVAYVLTIFANSSRIYASIVLQHQLGDGIGIESGIVHQTIGIAVYLTVLVAIYLTIEIIAKNKLSYAKPA